MENPFEIKSKKKQKQSISDLGSYVNPSNYQNVSESVEFKQEYHQPSQDDKYYVSPQETRKAIKVVVSFIAIVILGGLVLNIVLPSTNCNENECVVDDEMLTNILENDPQTGLYSQVTDFATGSEIVLTEDNGYKTTDSNDQDVIEYEPYLEIETGLYTVEVISTKTNLELSVLNENYSSYLYFFMSDLVDGDTTYFLSNVLIGDDDYLKVTNYSQGYELRLTPQTKYRQFSEANTPGFYTAGISIDAGDYKLTSTDEDEEVIVFVSTSNDNLVEYSSVDNPNITLKEGDTIVIDNEYTDLKVI